MKSRDEYVTKLKTNLDGWNADMAKWEGQMKAAEEDLKKRYAKSLEELRARREEALYQMKLVQGASATAWSDIAKGADAAWDRMQEAMAQAKTHFEKHPR